ncbi:MAG: hypothetical protein OXK20_05940, partial [Deltaproteobacteria bacterium]|nr:hypothetical protein [Deltaproteobacteria bacterium]
GSTHPTQSRAPVPPSPLFPGRAAAWDAVAVGAALDEVVRIACGGTELYDTGRDGALLYD